MDRKYTDQDVRRNHAALRSLAVRYLDNYVGEFEPLRGALCQLNETSDLTVPTIRLVLNCMRVDSTVRDLPSPGEVTFYASYNDVAKAVPKPSKFRPAYIDLPTKYKLEFGIHIGLGSSKIHRIWRSESNIRYYPAIGEFQCRLRWHCRPSWMIREANVRLIDVDAKLTLYKSGYAECEYCERSFADRLAKGVA